MNKCIYSGVQFELATGEHILQNFLGARFTSATIVCNEVQELFGSTIDVALERGLQPIRNLLGTRGGRGGDGPTLKDLSSTGAERFNLAPGGEPQLSEPLVEVQLRADGNFNVCIQLGAMNQLGWALAKLRAEIPNFKVDIEQVRSFAKSVKAPISGHVKLALNLGGVEYFRGIIKACMNLVGANSPDIAHESSLDAARRFVLDGSGIMHDFVRWSPDAAKLALPALGVADHFVGIASRGSAIEGIVQLFGDIVHSVRLTDNYRGRPFAFSYLVDPFREHDPAEQRNPSFDPACIPVFDSQLTLPGPAMWPPMQERVSRIIGHYYDRSHQSLVAQVVDDVLKPYDGQLFTEELATRFSQKMSEEIEVRFPSRS